MEHAPGTTTAQDRQQGDVQVPVQRQSPSAGLLRVLVADDEADLRLLVRMTLTLDSDDLLLLPDAIDGAAALAGWREHRPDVLVLDQRMPELTGLDVAAIVLAEAPDAAIVLFSASLDALTMQRAASLGVTCLDKYEVHRLATVVRDLATRRGLRPTS